MIIKMDKATFQMVCKSVEFANEMVGGGYIKPDDFLYLWAISYDDFDGEYLEEFVKRTEIVSLSDEKD